MSYAIRRLQRCIVADYAADVGLAANPHYYGGARLRPLPPLDTAVGQIVIVGAYPSARFEAVAGLRDVPVGDNMGPFEPERYFDGTSVRSQKSEQELAAALLGPLALTRENCWITDLVKVFLFKPGHRRKYAELGVSVPAGHEREGFADLGQRSLSWLAREVEVAQPELVITLGREVAGIVRGVEGDARRNALLTGEVNEVEVAGVHVRVAHLAHPGILMRGTPPRNQWRRLHHEEHVPRLRRALDQIRAGAW